jgi:hypothetical protein
VKRAVSPGASAASARLLASKVFEEWFAAGEPDEKSLAGRARFENPANWVKATRAAKQSYRPSLSNETTVA